MKLKNIYIGIVCVAFLSACTDKMDYHEYTNYEKDYVFSDFGRTAGFVNNIYSHLDQDLPGLTSLASATDEAEMALTYSSVLDYTNGNWSALNSKSQWGYYTAIRAANYFLKETKDLDFYDLRFAQDYQSQMNRFNRYKYEVRLLRAYYYFLLVRAYGDVPFTTDVLTEEQANTITRTPASEIFDFIMSECDLVASELPVTYSGLENDAAGGTTNPETGRVTRGTALALKARAALYRASKLFNESNDKIRWKEAAIANQTVIDYCAENGISLGKYTDLWGVNNYKATEVIFARRVGDTNNPEWYNFPIGMENANSGNCPTQTLVDAYEMKNGGEPDPNNPYTGRDPRLGMTIAVNGDKWPDTNPTPLEIYTGGRNAAPIQYATPTGYYLKKYLDGSTDISASQGTGGKRHSWVTFRLGEFYLNYAEAIFRYLDSPDATSDQFFLTAIDAVNVIRNRSDVKMPGLPKTLSSDEFWTRYKRERMVELAFEGHRFWDVRRWKEGGFTNVSRMEITKTGDETFSYKKTTKSLVWNDKMYFFPIPDSEIRKNPNLVQNPGWEIK
ncbi:RagB/SusD family nutrient uptake outer membrane protein [Bacteroides sp. 519]|uniref:RagB/SusD family nutrient uptake outer membrane protein n=1 Tax=Bacteroides sp. 519 TaxID=2302937 RepID=UPI0013D34E0C|nr:RagB/SusD family nutrient uptake outer membrane protein [Bacteroides sp. 519]NDV57362.1 RagB/SusD family nutrient uptake outer membrane protein [Bacteroides sp. 519]